MFANYDILNELTEEDKQLLSTTFENTVKNAQLSSTKDVE